MSRLIFRLQHVTIEEAEEVRELFMANDIAIYETSAGIFGTSVAAYWLEDDDQEALAKNLLKHYSSQRVDRVRHAYQQQRQQGEVESFWQRCKQHPLRMGFAMVAIACILFFSLVPFIELIN